VGQPFTVPTPEALPAERRGEHWWLSTPEREVRLSNLGKVFFPRTGYTKGDLLAYYWNVRDRILPYLANRPLTLKRLPNGAGSKGWIEKDAPKHAPDWLETCHIPNFLGDGESNDFPLCNDTSHLMLLANLGCIDLHPMHSRCDQPAIPDYVFVDIDPAAGASFDDVLIVARHVRAALDALALASYVKCTGATGVHVYVPIERNVEFTQTRAFVERIALAIRKADPDRVTLDWSVDKRDGKVFIDHNMNRRGQNAVSAWSVRPEPMATVAVPVTWDEVEEGFDPSDFDITNVHDRPREEPFVGRPVDVREAMEKLGVTA
jgi:bifunctional non-homologous end joining protein LigD